MAKAAQYPNYKTSYKKLYFQIITINRDVADRITYIVIHYNEIRSTNKMHSLKFK